MGRAALGPGVGTRAARLRCDHHPMPGCGVLLQQRRGVPDCLVPDKKNKSPKRPHLEQRIGGSSFAGEADDVAVAAGRQRLPQRAVRVALQRARRGFVCVCITRVPDGVLRGAHRSVSAARWNAATGPMQHGSAHLWRCGCNACCTLRVYAC